MVSFGAAHLISAEFLKAQRSRGEVLLFKRDHVRKGVFGKGAGDQEASAPIPFARDIAHNISHPPKDEIGAAAQTAHYFKPDTVRRQSGVFHWHGIQYEIKTGHNTRRILSDIDGWVQPGSLTALMVRPRYRRCVEIIPLIAIL